jgi:SCY1-like protein 1
MSQLFSSLLRSTVARVVGPGRDLPNINVGPRIPYDVGPWAHFSGTLRSDPSVAVSVFHFDYSSPGNRELLQVAKNAFRRLRSLRHPGLPAFLDGNLSETSVYIVTERVRPLSHPEDPRLTRLGLNSIARALEFLHSECGLAHGNIGMHSVLVSDSGDWKLFAFELLSTPAEHIYSPPVIRALHTSYRFADRNSIPPEGIASVVDGQPFAGDRFMFGSLVCATMPALSQLGRRFISPNPSSRPPVSFFSSASEIAGFPLISISIALEGFITLGESEREALARRIEASIADIPLCFAQLKVIPALVSAIELGTGLF